MQCSICSSRLPTCRGDFDDDKWDNFDEEPAAQPRGAAVSRMNTIP